MINRNLTKLNKFIQNITFKVSLISLASVGSLTMATTSAKAVQIDFNSAGWEKFGDVAIPTLASANASSNALLGDDGSADSDFNYSGVPAGEALITPDLQDFLGVSADALDIEGVATEGSAIKNNAVTIAAGNVLRFNWNFRTNEGEPYGLKDFAFFLVNDTVIKLADFTNTIQPSAPYLQETGIREYSFATPGTYKIAFGVVDINAYDASSALEISNARIEAVPEPLTTSGLVIGLGFGIVMRRKYSSSQSQIS